MTAVESQYFTLLRAALWDTSVDIEDHVDWQAVLKMARYHGNNVLVSDVATKMTGDNRPSDKMLAKMQNDMRGNLLNQMQLKHHLVTAVRALRENNIEPVLLKGFGLARLYPNPSLRQFGDIDLFVGLADFHQACALLRSLPGAYTWAQEVDVGRHYNVEFGNYPIEIHRVSADVVDPAEHEAYAAIEEDGLRAHPQRVDFDGFEMLIPSKEFMVFFTFFHLWHHFITSGAGLRQLSDVAMTLHAYHGQLDLDKLRQWLEAMHLMQPWQTFGYVMVESLGLPEEEVPFYDAGCQRRAQILYSRIMEEGNFNRKRNFKLNRPKQRLFQKIHAFICIFIDYFHLAKVFPDQASREMRTSMKMGFSKNFGKK